ncbi:malonyl-ACP O-methyltransferase BioC [Vibrio sp. IRLE0018]|uniref:malonyl-ACP O-methyltransferase BioC n=1 Tax=Vibrio TaxID=662 RepID=UPI001592E189|nr:MULTISPECIES: malonyl-ACP O-methyltransferase BioC [Vibrio]MCF8778247.1 malonyl-ACP O-methyltransferase BioC [Vibrio floridensis]NVC62513.1 malonyl-ACP O-methyltransferase BioC [Vibrio sp. 05-20-BW147]HAV6899066.1 malonyl-ACP O-methyltransferase BioC [Vibrio vulnificus]HDY7434908.1 malonyl-ACP O-methyltransferase BioC [Vibrio vulnificus]
MEQAQLYPSFDDTQADKLAIAQAFGKAAKTYDQHAAFQRDVGHRLLAKLPEDLSGWRVLDLGCGTGYFSQQLQQRGARVVCADLSIEMLAQSAARCGEENVAYRLADAESLPFSDNEFDAVFSSLALQWCDDLSVPLREMNRVTKPQGQILFSTLLDGSLKELKHAWAKIDTYQHVNRFISTNQVKIALAQSHSHNHHLDLTDITVWYESAFAVMRDLKGIGANHVSGRSHGLTTRQALRSVEQEYQTFQNHLGQVPASYKVCLGVIQL